MFQSTRTCMLLSIAFALAGLLQAGTATAQNDTRDRIDRIEQEYARINGGRNIPDDQLEYYLDRANNGWTMAQIERDMESLRLQKSDGWQPASGWIASELICTSVNNRYRECPAPFRGRAVVTYQISQTPCIEGSTWGQKAGAVWVNGGCRARFGMVVGGGNAGGPVGPGPHAGTRLTCQSIRGGYKECATGFRGAVELVNVLSDRSACIENRTWGQRPGTIWVTRGCRAEFASIGRPGPRDDSVWNKGYGVTCTSNRGNRGECEWDRRYGSPRLAETYSRNACIEGSSWGYENRQGLIWVSAGCRARFVSTRSNFAR
jgi:Protein of unknown function (DUF3011)